MQNLVLPPRSRFLILLSFRLTFSICFRFASDICDEPRTSSSLACKKSSYFFNLPLDTSNSVFLCALGVSTYNLPSKTTVTLIIISSSASSRFILSYFCCCSTWKLYLLVMNLLKKQTATSNCRWTVQWCDVQSKKLYLKFKNSRRRYTARRNWLFRLRSFYFAGPNEMITSIVMMIDNG